MALAEFQNILKNRKNQQKLAMALAAVLAVGAGYGIYKIVTRPKPLPPKPPLVRTITLEQANGYQEAAYPGALHGQHESVLAFQVPGKIAQRLVNLGDKVTEGQVLMTLDPQDIVQGYNAAQSAYTAAESNYNLAAENVSRFTKLKNAGAVSQATLDSYILQRDTAVAKLAEAEAALNSNSHKLSYTELTADTDGYIAAITGEPGMIVAAGTQLVTLVAAGSQEVRINVPESALSKLKPNQEAEITFWALDNVKVKGYIRDIGAMADPYTKTYKVNVAIPHLPAEAKLGMTAKVVFKQAAATDKSKLRLPASAIYTINDKKQVWLVKDNRVKLKEVTIENYDGNDVIVTSGLELKDQVVTAGLAKLLPDMEVRTQPAANNQKSGEQ